MKLGRLHLPLQSLLQKTMKKKPAEKQSVGIYSRYTPAEAKLVKKLLGRGGYPSLGEAQRVATLIHAKMLFS